MYSWAANGYELDYVKDRNDAEVTVPRFGQFLRYAKNSLRIDKLYVVTHSTGGWVAARALHDLSKTDDLGGLLDTLVFAAPDVDARVFRELAASFTERVQRVTLYASNKDRALAIARTLAGYPRAGQTEPDLVVMSNLDTIDASAVDTSFLGHLYYGDNRVVVDDLHSLLVLRKSPADRGLKRRLRQALPYWLMAP
jgi:esterase/lipase superfamily enzyme